MFVQAPASGLADTFGNPSLATTFGFFSPVRLFAPVGSTITDVTFFVPGSNGETPAATSGFGAVFSDVDSPDGGGRGVRQSQRRASSEIQYYDCRRQAAVQERHRILAGDGERSPSSASSSDDPRITCIRIITGHRTPEWGTDPEVDFVVMDDFVYGEPQPR